MIMVEIEANQSELQKQIDKFNKSPWKGNKDNLWGIEKKGNLVWAHFRPIHEQLFISLSDAITGDGKEP